MKQAQKVWRVIGAIIVIVGCGVTLSVQPGLQHSAAEQVKSMEVTGVAADTLETLSVKGRAPKTDYAREQFGDGWASVAGCDTRNMVLKRDLKDVAVNAKCQVISGVFDDPYTGKTIKFTRGASTSSEVQIDHVVALSDAWQKGAQQLAPTEREALANDPLELLASSGAANQQKSDSDAASWLPSNKSFRCQYVARQIAVKKKYNLWVTSSEKEAIRTVLSTCPGQVLPTS
jgi:hypothetical protein